MHIGKSYIFLIILAIPIVVLLYQHEAHSNPIQENEPESVNISEELPENKNTSLRVIVEENNIFSTVAAKAGLDEKQSFKLYEELKPVYDLANIKIGRQFIFNSNQDGELVEIIYNIDNEQELIVSRALISEDWRAVVNQIDYEIREKTIEGQLRGSLYQSALDQGADEKVIIQFAESLEYSIDFANDPREGDKYKFVYEERFRDGQFVMSGRVLAGAYLNNNKLYQSFYYPASSDGYNYYDENGNSVQKMFLRAPLSFKYISSPFTTGSRYVEKFGVATKHRAVDYAAAAGTPIRSIGSGVVISAGWSNAGYGNVTKIKHDSVYSTLYAHQSKIIVKKGERVSQGQIIGYVGSTGFSTGPHLHLEMIKNGVNVDPAKEILPPGKPIDAADKENFNNMIEIMKDKIKI